uniref:Uncharacterized protein n=1 Tax=Cucumis melo TaxID=3656 RepID=A0A9I9CD21_CUCME
LARLGWKRFRVGSAWNRVGLAWNRVGLGETGSTVFGGLSLFRRTTAVANDTGRRYGRWRRRGGEIWWRRRRRKREKRPESCGGVGRVEAERRSEWMEAAADDGGWWLPHG